MQTIRIGIDVGGTFTDAVALDDTTGEVCGQVKVPTTHTAPEGVALGIVLALQRLLESGPIAPENVRFIAHATTQATNALLEGDVATVGIIATGKGIEGIRARSETKVEPLELAPGKRLEPLHVFTEVGDYAPALALLRDRGVQVIVAAAPFSVDDATEEQRIMEMARNQGMAATGTHEITKLYGLRVRTRTAVINGCILPRMIESADRTEESVRLTGIPAPLMIMRSDGGVMTIREARRRPILTLLSGPAAGVAGATMYEKVSQGIFLEVGGTSVDISVIRDGRVMIQYAEVGGHKTYVRSLDVRTLGVAGGSMIRFQGGKIAEVGPLSAHIAGLPYAVYADPSEIITPQLEIFAPKPGDPADYVAIRCEGGKRFALTLACAANLLGYVREGDYAWGNVLSAERAFVPLAQVLNVSAEKVGQSILRSAVGKVLPVVETLLQEYGLDKRQTVLIGGGGGAAALVPILAETLGMEARLARNHQIISPIGVALALVREVVERTIPSPTQEDILRVRKEAEEAARRSGAAEGTIEVLMEVDTGQNVVRAIATGATDLTPREPTRQELPAGELAAIAARSMGCSQVKPIAQLRGWHVFEGLVEEKTLFGLRRRIRREGRILDAEGVIRLAKQEMNVKLGMAAEWKRGLQQTLTAATTYGDGGATLPETYILCGTRLLDLSGIHFEEQMLALAASELAGYSPDEPIAIVTISRKA